MKRLLALLAVLLLAHPAHAYPVLPGIYGASVSAPVLSNVSVSFGAQTQANRGGVSLASRDVSKWGFHFKGIDVWNGAAANTPVSWTIRDTTATAGYTPGSHWELDGTTACLGATAVSVSGTNAPTPRPCAAGVTAQLNKGPYTFEITATDALGRTSTPVTLTYAIVNNAVSWGDAGADYNTVNNTIKTAVPAAWTSTGAPSGAKILLSTGANWISDTFVSAGTRVFLSFDFSAGAQVTFANADAARPGGLWGLELQPSKNLKLDSLTFTGPPDTPSGQILWIYKGSDTITVQDVSIIRQAADISEADSSSALTIGGVTAGGATNVTVNNLTARYVPGCILVAGNYAQPAQHITVNNTHCRYVYVNFLTVSTVDDVTFNDTYLISAMRKDDRHVDAVQISNAASPNNLHFHRLLYVQADGNGASQGPVFGGRAGVSGGHIDNGTPGVAGNILHIDTFDTGNNIALNGSSGAGASLVSTTDGLGASITPGTQITANTCIKAGTSCTISGAPQLVGTSGAPVTVYTAPWTNFTMDGIAFASSEPHGLDTNGVVGTSTIKNFTYVKDNGYLNGQSFSKASFTGTLESFGGVAMLTATAPTGFQKFYFDMQIFGPTGCNTVATYNYPFNCTTIALRKIGVSSGAPWRALPLGWSGAAAGTGGAGAYNLSTPTLTASSQGMFASVDLLSASGPTATAQYSDAAVMYSGTATWSSGFFWDHVSYLKTDRTPGTKPTNFTLDASVVQANLTSIGFDAMHTFAVGTFNNGDPQYTVSLIAPAHWAGLTDAQVISEYVTYLVPKTGGPLDAGGGSWYGALTQDGKWNDGSGKTPGH